MNNNEKVAREIFGEINEKDDYLIGMMAENPSIKWRRFKKVLDETFRPVQDKERPYRISQMWHKIDNERSERPIVVHEIVWMVNGDEYDAIIEYERKNLKKINHNRESVIQEWDKLCELLH
jgi:hypothetical protein